MSTKFKLGDVVEWGEDALLENVREDILNKGHIITTHVSSSIVGETVIDYAVLIKNDTGFSVVGIKETDSVTLVKNRESDFCNGRT